MALEVGIQPREATLTEAEIEALSAGVAAAGAKAGRDPAGVRPTCRIPLALRGRRGGG